MRLCWSFTENILFGKISSHDKVGIELPTDELVYENTIGIMPCLSSAVFFPVSVKKSSVSNQ